MGSLCYEAWKTLIKRVGGAPKTWRDLGHFLEISVDDLDYIENSVKEDPTDIVLKIFRQNENATLDKVLDAFVKMKRYDILKALESPLTQLASFFYKEESKSDTGYHSSSKERLKHPIVNLKNIPNDLPPVLRSKYNLIFDEKPKEPVQPKAPSPQNNYKDKIEKKGPILFLTFAEDGLETALNIKNKINNWSEEFAQISVITLNDQKDDVLQNPEIYIRDYFEKADFVVPIVTVEYMNRIKSHSRNIPNTTDNLDFKYHINSLSTFFRSENKSLKARFKMYDELSMISNLQSQQSLQYPTMAVSREPQASGYGINLYMSIVKPVTCSDLQEGSLLDFYHKAPKTANSISHR
ncbi:hypothetical protein EVAR_53241_1 [Eumeta japonica]|uniref:Death domain-containing protein n=1 Tax=Eumeta variegata TaxID=151549 RepID=A0A4C1XBV4_EUMVA|nr:hypothetical protein EVAR_53241_1 [Eumeta japonica]